MSPVNERTYQETQTNDVRCNVVRSKDGAVDMRPVGGVSRYIQRVQAFAPSRPLLPNDTTEPNNEATRLACEDTVLMIHLDVLCHCIGETYTDARCNGSV